MGIKWIVGILFVLFLFIYLFIFFFFWGGGGLIFLLLLPIIMGGSFVCKGFISSVHELCVVMMVFCQCCNSQVENEEVKRFQLNPVAYWAFEHCI
jgi:hypothetical protein